MIESYEHGFQTIAVTFSSTLMDNAKRNVAAQSPSFDCNDCKLKMLENAGGNLCQLFIVLFLHQYYVQLV